MAAWSISHAPRCVHPLPWCIDLCCDACVMFRQVFTPWNSSSVSVALWLFMCQIFSFSSSSSVNIMLSLMSVTSPQEAMTDSIYQKVPRWSPLHIHKSHTQWNCDWPCVGNSFLKMSWKLDWNLILPPWQMDSFRDHKCYKTGGNDIQNLPTLPR